MLEMHDLVDTVHRTVFSKEVSLSVCRPCVTHDPNVTLESTYCTTTYFF